MVVLHLGNVLDDLARQIERLAERVRRTLEETILHILKEAVPRELTEERHRVRETLNRIRQNLIVPTPGTPDSVELLREDRNR